MDHFGVHSFGHHFGFPKLQFLHVLRVMGSLVVLFVVGLVGLFLVFWRVAQDLETNIIEGIMMRPIETMF